MAQLIHFGDNKEKHIKYISKTPIFVNRATSLLELKNKENYQNLLVNLSEEKSRIIEDYFSLRDKSIQEAIIYAHKSVRRRLAIDIIILYYIWIKNIKNEAEAINKIALKISQKILNKKDINLEPNNNDINNYKLLSEYFSVILVVPDDFFSNYFASLSFLTIEQRGKHALLKVQWQQKSARLVWMVSIFPGFSIEL